jgi:sugar phosphate isomerase/epimerase
VTTELPIGACGWCIDRHDPRGSIEVAGRDLGLRVVQIGFFTQDSVRNANPAAIVEAAHAADVTLVGAFVAFEDEDYSSITRIAETGGFAPDEAYASRLAVTRSVADLAAAVGCPSLSVHAGTVPTDSSSPACASLVARVREVADAAATRGLRLLLETGRESADALLRFIDSADRSNVGVNFDPGNFIIYGTDDPVAAVTKLRDRIELVHVKDAHHSPHPGLDYGRPAPVGAGDVQIARVVSKLRATGFRGPLLIECDTREAGLDAIRNAADYLRTLVS